jgi:hypothetical protein
MPKQGLSLRKAAAEVGCTHPAIGYAIKTGQLATFPDRSVDLAAVKKWWDGHTPSRRGRPRNDGTVRDPYASTPGNDDDPVAELMQVRGIFPDRAAAELHKATYSALSEELEFEKLAQSVVEVSEVAKAVGSEYTQVRTKLLSIPAENAPRLHSCKTVLELQDMLLSLLTQALESLTLDHPHAV